MSEPRYYACQHARGCWTIRDTRHNNMELLANPDGVDGNLAPRVWRDEDAVNDAVTRLNTAAVFDNEEDVT